MTGLSIRRTSSADLPALVGIFNHYVANGHVTFETRPSTVEDRMSWFARYGDSRHQLLVADDAGEVVGCTYSSVYRPSPAFDATVETSIYLAPNQRRRGLGSALYTELFQRVAEQPVHLAVAGIALPNDASIALHRKFGFEEVGTFREYARKHGEWISSTWFQRRIAAASS